MTLEQAVAEYAADIRSNPTHYKARIAADSEAAARAVLDGLDGADLAYFISSLRAEQRKIERLS